MQNEFGQEIPDDTPIVINLPGLAPITGVDDIRQLIAQEFSRAARAAEMESFEDANDFDVEDDEFPVSPHEYDRDTELADLEALQGEDPRQPPPQDRQPSPEPGRSPGGPDQGLDTGDQGKPAAKPAGPPPGPQ